MYTVTAIHPNANADFSFSVSAKSKGHARAVAYRKINDRFGAATLYMVGDVQKIDRWAS